MAGSNRTRLSRVIFIGTFLGLMVQFFIVRKHGEAYPMLQMPSFVCRGNLHQWDHVKVESCALHVHFPDGSVQLLTLRELLGNIPVECHPGLAAWVFRETAPTNQRRSELAVRREPSSELQAWIRQRLQTVFSPRSPTAAEFEWRLNEFGTATGQLIRRQSEFVSRFRVVLLAEGHS